MGLRIWFYYPVLIPISFGVLSENWHKWTLSSDSADVGFPGGPAGKESTCNAGDPGSILGWEDPLEKW